MRELRVGIAVSPTVEADPEWKGKFTRELAYASKIFENEFKLKFKPAIFWNWTPRDEARDMNYLMEDLKSNFPLDQVDLVIGVSTLTPSDAQAGLKDIHVIGRTHVFGGYLVLRHPRRTPLLHVQEETVLVHELGHLFGAAHTEDRNSVMSPVVERQIPSAFDPENREIIKMTRNFDFKRGIKALDLNTAKQLMGSYVKFTKTDQPFEFYYALGKCYAKAGKFQNAVEVWEIARKREPENPRVRYDLGVLYSRMGKTDAAQQELAAAVARFDLPSEEPYKAAALNILGGVYLKQGNLDAAYSAWSRCLAIRPDYFDARVNLAVVQIRRKQFQDGAKLLEQLLKASPDHVNILSHLGLAYYQTGRYREAIDSFNRALKVVSRQSPPRALDASDITQPAQLHTYLGFAHLKLSGPKAAIGHFETACRMRSTLDCHKQLGELYYQMGRWDEAIRELSAVLGQKKDLPSVYGALGASLYKKGEYKKAATIFNEGLRYVSDPKTKSIYHAQIGNIYRKAKSIMLAKQEFQLAIALDGANKDAHLGMAQVYLAEKDIPHAVHSLNHVLAMDPQYKQARQLLDQLKSRGLA